MTEKITKIGGLVRKFRLRAGMNQTNLELDINASSGSLSKIESGKVDPSKETILKIANVLKLDAYETVMLFNLDNDEYREIIKAINNIHLCKTKTELLKYSANDSLNRFKLQGCSIFLRRENELILAETGKSWYTEKAMSLMRLPFEKVRFSMINHKENAIVIAANTKEPIISRKLSECLTPVINSRISNLIESLIQMKGFCNIPMIDSASNVAGVFAISFSNEDIVTEKLPLLIGYCEAVACALEKFEV